ncbi:hypothetical protein V6N13_131162 [Hibiscus sabdariffa]
MGPVRPFKRIKKAAVKKVVDHNVLHSSSAIVASSLGSQPRPLDWWDEFSQRISVMWLCFMFDEISRLGVQLGLLFGSLGHGLSCSFIELIDVLSSFGYNAPGKNSLVKLCCGPVLALFFLPLELWSLAWPLWLVSRGDSFVCVALLDESFF